MSIAIGAIVLILLLIPGTFAISAYYGSISNKASGVHIPFNDLLMKGLIISIIIHFLAITVIEFFNYEPAFGFLYTVVAGNPLNISNHLFGLYCKEFILYTFTLVIITFFLSKLFKSYIQNNNYDLIYHSLKSTSYWFHMFGGRHLEEPGIRGTVTEIDFIFLDVLTKNHFLYSGRLVDFNYSPYKDELENIVLGNSFKRRLIGEDIDPHNCKMTESKSIEGDVLVIEASSILNINISYIKLTGELKPRITLISEN